MTHRHTHTSLHSYATRRWSERALRRVRDRWEETTPSTTSHGWTNRRISMSCLAKAQILSGDDVTSRISTKLAAMHCSPIAYLDEFAERDELKEKEISQVEEYLVRVWAGARSQPSAKTLINCVSRFTSMHLYLLSWSICHRRRVLYVGTPQ